MGSAEDWGAEQITACLKVGKELYSMGKLKRYGSHKIVPGYLQEWRPRPINI